LALEPAQRKLFLQRACGADETLRKEVESLLEYADDGDTFLEGSAVEAAAEAMAAEAIGTGGVKSPEARTIPAEIGHYRVLRLLGEGGMGAVYEAEQDRPRRMVALKVIKPGFATAENLRHFQYESQALGRLHHPGIAQIFEASTADTGFGPQPYFAMELIRGRALDEYADVHHLQTRARLDLTAKICDAVDHAHQRGVIHRDLKPSNILVDETGQPKIVDFGVARVTEPDMQHTHQTGLGQIVGTLAYMSPEQVLGDARALDGRSDVYALGVILYELLAGRLPYSIQGKSLHEALNLIREEEPEPLSSIKRNYRGDIDVIVAKALEKDKARRYALAADLAGDIRRYLNDQPITARPASASYKLQKFARRNKSLVAGTAAVFLVLVTGVAVSTWEAVRARKAEQAAAKEAAAASAISDFLRNDLLAQASASTQAGSQVKPDRDLTVRTALNRAAAKIAGRFGKQPEIEASIRDTIGRTYLDLGLYPEARAQLESAVEISRKVFGAENPKTLRTTSQLGRLAYIQGKYPEARQLFEAILPVQRRILGAEHPDTLLSGTSLASVYTAEGKYAQAEKLYGEALRIRLRALGPEHPDTLSSMNGLANAYTAEGNYAKAEALDSRTLEIRRRVLGPEHPDTLMSMNNLAGDYAAEGKYAESTAIYSQFLEIQRRVLGPEHHDTVMSMHNLATVYAEEGEYEKAETLYRQTLELQTRVLGPEHPETLLTMNDLAGAYNAEGKYSEAEPLCRQALQIQQRVLGPEHHDAILSMNNLADTLAGQKHYRQAEALLSRAIEISRRALGPDHPNSLGLLADAASVYRREGNYKLAESYATQALAGLRRALGPEQGDTIAAGADLALAYISQGEFAEAEPLAREAVNFARKAQPDTWQRFRYESLLGASLAGQKKCTEAEPLLSKGYQGMIARTARMAVPDRYHLDLAHEWLEECVANSHRPIQ
jgi:tetratricopeptide (TPR) repeat protein